MQKIIQPLCSFFIIATISIFLFGIPIYILTYFVFQLSYENSKEIASISQLFIFMCIWFFRDYRRNLSHEDAAPDDR